MKKSILTTITIAALGLPFAASAQQLSETQLIELAVARNICGGSEILGARYSAENTVTVTCQSVAAPATGGGLTGGLGGSAAGSAVGGLLLIAIAASGDGSSGTTTTTN